MSEFLRRLLQQAAATGPVEALAVLLGMAYILLAIRQKRACWIAGALSTVLYVVVFLDARLYLQSLLQIVYVLLAIHGWRSWGREQAGEAGLTVRRPGWRTHLAAIVVVLALSAASVPLLDAWTESAAAWPDALGTWSSIAATWLMIRKVAESWWWWIVVDVGLATLFATQGLLITAVLYGAFALLAVAGWRAWRHGREIP